jgi:ubiquinone/menaquinone biosynthesis C-methylase UbiE
MKTKKNREHENPDSSLYWHHNAKQFADFYRRGSNFFSPEVIVQKFLSKRTDTLRLYTSVSPKSIVLDLGCGSGEQMREFAPRVHFIYGIDYSKQMIDLAKKELSTIPQKKYTLIVADAAKIPLPDKSIDCIMAMGLLDYVASPSAVLSECKRVLRPHGVLVVSMPQSPSIFSFFRTPIGIYFRRILFHLPPIKNTMTHDESIQLLHDHGLKTQKMTSIWGAMWMIQATRDRSS